MAIVTPVTKSPSTTNTTRSAIANNFDQFLTLLTTQLKNQSPLDPLDANQFTQQLVQFASVEQQIKTNDSLSALVLASKTTNVSNALGFIGTRITASGNTSVLKSGKAAWTLNAPRPGTALVTIKDKDGNEVYSQKVTLGTGDNAFTWDGKRPGGSTAPEGQYTMTVSAKDANATGMVVSTDISGPVDSVDLTGDTPVLSIGATRIPATSVKTISR